jgi:hypothetical protein
MAALYEEVYQASCTIPPARRNASIGPAPAAGRQS